MIRPGPTTLATTLRAFFAEYLPGLRGLSPHTVRSYRDSVRLLLRFAATQRRRPVAALDVEDLSVPVITAFLAHLEQTRHTTVSTRNVRLAALHTFCRFLAAQHPDHVEQAQRILGIPFKRTRPRPIEYLEYATALQAKGRVVAGHDRGLVWHSLAGDGGGLDITPAALPCRAKLYDLSGRFRALRPIRESLSV